MTSIISFIKSIENRSKMLIEIQGELQHSIETQFNYMYLGKLTKVNENEYILNIGNHQISGREVKLKNPFLLCKKPTNPNEQRVTVIEVIRSKIHFTSRPTPLLNANPNKTK